ncbi:hypothetical protein [Methylobacterium nigriterrae]
MRDIIKIFAAGTILTGYALLVPGLIDREDGPAPRAAVMRVASLF